MEIDAKDPIHESGAHPIKVFYSLLPDVYHPAFEGIKSAFTDFRQKMVQAAPCVSGSGIVFRCKL